MVYVDIKMTATPVDVGGSFVESLFLNLKINNSERLLLGCMYRSPNSNTENNKKMLELLNNINYASYSNVVIVGDFNMPEINWEAPILMNVQGFSMEFIKTMNEIVFTAASNEAYKRQSRSEAKYFRLDNYN